MKSNSLIIKAILYLGVVFLTFNCRENPKTSVQKITDGQEVDSTPVGIKDNKINKLQEDTSIQQKPIDLKAAKNINVLSADKRTGNDSVDIEYFKKCSMWTLSKNDIKTIMRFLKPIDNHEFHYVYYVLPCEMTGLMEIDNQKFTYVVNAGAYMKLRNSDTTFTYGCESKRCNKYFLVKGGTQ
jgi:hypothetical protein